MDLDTQAVSRFHSNPLLEKINIIPLVHAGHEESHQNPEVVEVEEKERKSQS